MRRSAAARLAVIACAGSAAVYAILAGTEAGRGLDGEVLRRDLDGSWEWAARLPAGTGRPAVIAAVLLVLCWIAVRDGRHADAVRAVVLVGGAPVLALAYEEALEAVDPLGVEAARDLGPGFYPSGHAAAAMALALAALIATPAAAGGRTLLLAAAGWAAAGGWAAFADAGHHVSDAAGGFLLAAAIGGALVLGRRGGAPRRAGLPWNLIALTIAALVAVCAVLGAVDDLRVPHSALQPALILGGAAIGGFALALVRAFDVALAAEAHSRTR